MYLNNNIIVRYYVKRSLNYLYLISVVLISGNKSVKALGRTVLKGLQERMFLFRCMSELRFIPLQECVHILSRIKSIEFCRDIKKIKRWNNMK